MPISLPKVTLDILSAVGPVANQPQKVLFVGQKTNGGSATSGDLIENIGNDNSWDALFGADSMLTAMIEAAREVNDVTQFDAIPLDDDGGATAATGTITIAGPATGNGTLVVEIGSSVNHRYEIAVETGDGAADIASALATAITIDLDSPVTAAPVAGVVTVTAVHGGLEGNTITMRAEVDPVVIGVSVVGMSGGAVNPDLTGLFDPIENIRYQTIVFPSTYDRVTLYSFLDGRFNTVNQILDGVGIQSETDTFANLVSTIAPLNSQSYVVLANGEAVAQTNYFGSTLFELGYIISSRFAAARALRLTENASISDLVTASVSASDNRGGAAIASLPYFNTPFPRLPLIDNDLEFTNSEVENLRDVGGTVLGNNLSRTSIISGEAVTTYKFDSASNPDNSFKFLNYVDTISNIREYYFNNLKSRFSQTRLTTGDIQPGRTMANEQTIRAFCTELYVALSGPDFVLTVAGEEALNYYKDNLSVVLDLSNGLVTIDMETPIVTQLREILGTIRISFTTEG